MANKRVYQEVNKCLVNAIQLAGATQISITEDYVVGIDPEWTGGAGPSGRVQTAQRIRGQIRTADCVAALAALIASPTTASWYGRESGLATLMHSTLKAPIPYALAMELSKTQLGAATLDFSCRFAEADTFATMLTVSGGEAAPVPQLPTRVLRILSATHGALAVPHIEALSLRIQVRGGNPLEDWGDNDIGVTAIEIPEYDAPAVSLTMRDSQEVAAEAKDLATKLLEAGTKDLVVVVQPVALAATATLTIRNVLFTSRQKTGEAGWSGHVLQGSAGFFDPAPSNTWRTLNHVTPAERLVNWATT